MISGQSCLTYWEIVFGDRVPLKCCNVQKGVRRTGEGSFAPLVQLAIFVICIMQFFLKCYFRCTVKTFPADSRTYAKTLVCPKTEDNQFQGSKSYTPSCVTSKYYKTQKFPFSHICLTRLLVCATHKYVVFILLTG